MNKKHVIHLAQQTCLDEESGQPPDIAGCVFLTHCFSVVTILQKPRLRQAVNVYIYMGLAHF